MTTADFQEIAPTLPTQPGIYKFIDPKGVILYVGKAKILKSRLSSYFGERKDRQLKTKALVRLAHHIEFTIVGSEQDALLLECALIKEHQPRYNVMLKDGKTYPYICVKIERFPRVFVTRRVIRDGSTSTPTTTPRSCSRWSTPSAKTAQALAGDCAGFTTTFPTSTFPGT